MNAKKLVMLLAVVAIAVGGWMWWNSDNKAQDCDCCYVMVVGEDGTTMERGDAKDGCDCADYDENCNEKDDDNGGNDDDNGGNDDDNGGNDDDNGGDDV